jgi:hypothetical protein
MVSGKRAAGGERAKVFQPLSQNRLEKAIATRKQAARAQPVAAGCGARDECHHAKLTWAHNLFCQI